MIVQGHTLVSEGAPHEWSAEHNTWVRIRWNSGTSGTGRALCSCGATSGVFYSGRLRKRWHREHKDEVQRG